MCLSRMSPWRTESTQMVRKHVGGGAVSVDFAVYEAFGRLRGKTALTLPKDLFLWCAAANLNRKYALSPGKTCEADFHLYPKDDPFAANQPRQDATSFSRSHKRRFRQAATNFAACLTSVISIHPSSRSAAIPAFSRRG